MKHNYFVFCTMITLFCFSTIAMEQPSSKKGQHRVLAEIAKLRGSANEVLEYVDAIFENQYGFKVISELPKPTTKESTKGTDKTGL